MTNDELRRECEALLLKWFDMGARGSWGGAMLDEFVSFSKQQQAAGVRMAGKCASDCAFIMGNDMWRERKQVNDIADWCEAQAKELAP